jgi:hypothetical protein
MAETKQARESRFQLFGWALFLGCSILFIVDSVVSGSPWGIAGSVVFLLGCIIFLIPFTWKKG